MANVVRAASHLNHSSRMPLSVHAVVNKITPVMPSWCTQWPITDMPEDAVRQHQNLSRGKNIGASVFLWKPFLYRLLPLNKVIVLDLDIVVVHGSGIGALWDLFKSFEPGQVLGVVPEQGPTYFRYGRHAGFNGGVQLHNLHRMHATKSPRGIKGVVTYDEALQRCTEGGCTGWDAIEANLGDQTLYTKLCQTHPHLCHRLPCGWNRQMSTKYYTVPNFRSEWHACPASQCHLLHFNQPLLESAVPALQLSHGPIECADCRHGIEALVNHTIAHPSKNPRFSWGASKQYMAQVIESCCCNTGTGRGNEA